MHGDDAIEWGVQAVRLSAVDGRLSVAGWTSGWPDLDCISFFARVVPAEDAVARFARDGGGHPMGAFLDRMHGGDAIESSVHMVRPIPEHRTIVRQVSRDVLTGDVTPVNRRR